MSSDKSVLKFNPPRLLIEENSAGPTSSSNASQAHHHKASFSDTNLVRRRDHYLPPINAATPKEEENLGDIQEILNCILPPKQWEKDDKFWVQTVSTTPATRIDIIKLQDQIDTLLEGRKAKEFGICPIRRDIYNQFYDELLRQVTVNCAERGLLLMRVRDELRMSLATYQSLYESAIAFGLRKALGAEQKKSDAEIKCEELEKQNLELKKQVRTLELEMGDNLRRFEDQKQMIEEKYKDGNERLKLANTQLKVSIAHNENSVAAVGITVFCCTMVKLVILL